MRKFINILTSNYKDEDSKSFFIVNSFIKSYTCHQIKINDKPEIFSNSIFVIPEVSKNEFYLIFKNLINNKKNKIILFGDLNIELKKQFNLNEIEKLDFEIIEAANQITFKESKELIHYNSDIPYLPKFIKDIDGRPIARFDFQKEWNNHYYGHIDDLDSERSLSIKCVIRDENYVAYVKVNSHKIPLISEFTINTNKILWVNRNIGLIDLPEWKIIEDFISNFNRKGLPCIPYISELKESEKGLVTMRLDCDEDIDSAMEVFKLYKSKNIPLSLALTTKLLESKSKIPILPKLVLENNGNLLSHSHSHPNNWGESTENIEKEITISKSLIEKTYGTKVDLAVSPFHHLNALAVKLLNQNDFKGIVAGISSSHHKFLYMKGGQYSIENNLIIHSQQCMMHGDCINKNRSIKEYFKSIKLLSNLNYSFGYLDHPISERYDYGWGSKENQVSAHLQIINFCLKNTIKIISQAELFKRLKAKDNLKIFLIKKNGKEFISIDNTSFEEISIVYKNKIYPCSENKSSLIEINI